jgi:hypothetical protein
MHSKQILECVLSWVLWLSSCKSMLTCYQCAFNLLVTVSFNILLPWPLFKLIRVLLVIASFVKFVSKCNITLLIARSSMWRRYVSLMEFWNGSLSVWYVVILVSSAESTHIDCELTVGVQYSCVWEEAGGKVWETEELHALQCPSLCMCTVQIEKFSLYSLFHTVNVSIFALNAMKFH